MAEKTKTTILNQIKSLEQPAGIEMSVGDKVSPRNWGNCVKSWEQLVEHNKLWPACRIQNTVDWVQGIHNTGNWPNLGSGNTGLAETSVIDI